MLSSVRLALFGIAPSEARLDVRGFAATGFDKQQRLEEAGRAFIHGYCAALRQADPRPVGVECEVLPPHLRGFAYEGAGMGLAVCDLFSRGVPRRFNAFVAGPATAHIYMAHVGAGWAMARCPWGIRAFLPHLDPMLRWLTIDGLGFHQGFFHPADWLDRHRTDRHWRKWPLIVDAGLGRALWFASGAQASVVIDRIRRFPAERLCALWSGLGLAVTYAAGASGEEIDRLVIAAGGHAPAMRAGAAFAAKARSRAGNPTPDSERACQRICGLGLEEAALVTDVCLHRLASRSTEHDYAAWRSGIATEIARRVRDLQRPAGTLIAS